ncbi:hypothetical protein PoB_002877500 [Plakobranchus ocellatus]|uniref:Uncharacterized protein n=1 Tax=Plakobranchus ocellatus TaxID=259542 RepID=A0AAV4A4D3_9GAST|nr:hypothetical protein PoB_002877500 [Plakobranchus ocellatus]
MQRRIQWIKVIEAEGTAGKVLFCGEYSGSRLSKLRVQRARCYAAENTVDQGYRNRGNSGQGAMLRRIQWIKVIETEGTAGKVLCSGEYSGSRLSKPKRR